jgi:hypothetical protein
MVSELLEKDGEVPSKKKKEEEKKGIGCDARMVRMWDDEARVGL